MNSYWDLYVAYVHHCVEYNKKYDLDPHHYEMEWNHFLPQCIFGDQPIGQYLLLKQHAIASALQTLTFKKNCMHGKHKTFLPGTLLNLVWFYFCKDKSKIAKEYSEYYHSKKDEMGRSVLAVTGAEALHSIKNEEGKSVAAVQMAKRVKEIYGEDQKEWCKRAASIKYQCTVTGKISTAGPLTLYQRKRGIDTSNRVLLY